MSESSFIPYHATVQLPGGEVLVLAPHPDDEVFGCAGAIMRHVAQGDAVTVIVVTDGRAATEHADEVSLLNYIEIRQQESRTAAALLGYGLPEFWGEIDRQLVCSPALIQKLLSKIESLNITRLYAPSPLEVHPDHYALALIAIEAVKQCRQPITLVMYEVGVPLYPNILLDITDFSEKKQQAIQSFVSQQSLLDYGKPLQALNIYRAYTLPSTVTAAEAYYEIANTTLQIQPWRCFGYSRQQEWLVSAYSKIEQLEQQVVQQQQELATVYHSRSWRLTAGLRWLNRFFSANRNG